MKEKVHLGRWRSADAEQKYRAMEDAIWNGLGTRPRPEPIDVATSLGPTRAYRWAGEGTPIVFLHGISGTSMVWTPFADALVGRDVYAVDIIGDVGRSRQDVPFTDQADLATWLDEVLAGLGIDHAHLAGHSLGGFVALDTAVHRPQRVASLVLLDPVGIGKLHMLGFLLWGIPVLLGALLPAPIRRWIGRRFRMPLLEDRAMMRMAFYGNLKHVPGFPNLVPFTDDELRGIRVPVVLLVGEKTEVFDATEVMDRARLIPDLQAELVAGAGHALTVSHFDICASRLSHVTDATL